MPAISIIIPLYNKKKYLAPMLESLLQQSFKDFEAIIIDDGSTDGSGQIADSFAMNDSRVRVKHVKNGGVSHARNIGLSLVQGDYITFIDADDSISIDYLEKLYQYIKNNDVDLVVSGVTKIWEDGIKKQCIVPPYVGVKDIKELLPDFVRVQQNTGIYGYCVAKIFSKSILGLTCFDEKLHLAEDFDFYLKIYQKVKAIYFSKDTNYYYLQGTENSPFSVEDREIDYYSQMVIQLRFAEYLKKMGYYDDENRKIVERNISNYMYLTLHYATEDSYDQYFTDLHKICQKEDFKSSEQKYRQKLILFLLRHNMKCISWLLIQCYWKIRRFARG